MRALGILDMIGLAVTLAFALPIAIFGVTWLVDGRPLGLAFVALAAAMVAVERYLSNPLDPADVVDGVSDRLRRGRD